ncbi:MAG: EAL domain-containing protein [Pseudomonadota bacterium]
MAKRAPAFPVAFMVNAAGVIVSWNMNCQKLLGYAAEEALHMPISSFIHQTGNHQIDLRKPSPKNQFARRTVELVCRDEKRLRASMTIFPQQQSDGDSNGCIVLIDTFSAGRAESRKIPINDKNLGKLIDSVPGAFYVIDTTGRCLLWNRGLEKAADMTREEVAEAHILDFFDGKEKFLIEEAIKKAVEKGQANLEAHVVTRAGKRTPYLFSGSRVTMGRKVYVCGLGLDITSRKKNEEILYLRERALHGSVNGVVITRCCGADNLIEYVNPAFEKITGYRQEEIIGTDPRFMRASDLDLDQRKKIRQALCERRSIQVVMRNQRKNGELFWIELKIATVTDPEEGEVTHFMGVISDITTAKSYETQLEYLANHDPLTGLVNRNLLRDRLELAIHQGRRQKSLVAVAFIDLDNFKFINDTFGHEKGDIFLKHVAHRLQGCIRESDTAARVGGDEFVLILTNQPNLTHIADLIERVRQSIAEATQTMNCEFSSSASICVSIYPDDGENAELLLREADIAMYHAKSLGRNNYKFYSSDLNTTVRRRLLLEMSLRRAIEQKEIFAVFQPKVDIKTGKIVGAEALMRWNHPLQGIILPHDFVPIAEETGLIIPLGDWMLLQACSVLKHLHALGHLDFSISVNLSIRQFIQTDFVDQIADMLTKADLTPSALELEVTESLLMDDPTRAIGALSQLKALGVRLSIDDFGTGYSSLSHLQKFPVDYIKIDQSFMRDVSQGSPDAIITKAILSLGHSLNLKVIAEGVETKEQLAFLNHHECDQVQGYYFSEPISMGMLQALVESKTTLPCVPELC